MKAWLKGLGSALAAAAVAFLAFMAVNQVGGRKRQADKWRQRAEDEIKSGRNDALARAKAAQSQAKLHDAKAEEARKKIETRIDDLGKRDETVADIVDRWRRPDGVRDDAF